LIESPGLGSAEITNLSTSAVLLDACVSEHVVLTHLGIEY